MIWLQDQKGGLKTKGKMSEEEQEDQTGYGGRWLPVVVRAAGCSSLLKTE